jgi:hypothetical protein
LDSEEKNKLERKFDRDLTEGEAAEIKNTEVLHTNDEDFYENRDDTPAVPVVGLLSHNNGRP